MLEDRSSKRNWKSPLMEREVGGGPTRAPTTGAGGSRPRHPVSARRGPAWKVLPPLNTFALLGESSDAKLAPQS